MLDIRSILQFVVVAEELSFTKAAKRLGLAQPWLSSRIRMLEQQMGVRLLDRSTRRVGLTEHGERLYEIACPLSEMIDNVLQDAERIAELGAPKLRIGASASDGRDLRQVALLERFVGDHPEVGIELERGYTRALLDRVRRGKLDLCFATRPFDDEDLETLAFSAQRLALHMRPDDPLAKSNALTSPDLIGRRIGVFAHAVTPEVDGFFQDLASRGVVLAPLLDLHKSMVLDDRLGPDLLVSTIVPDRSDAPVQDGVLRRLIEDGPVLRVDLVRRKGFSHPKANDLLWDLARKTLP